MPAPIALFVYNRPEHTRRTLESLSANRGYDPSLITVFADGPPPAAAPALRDSIAQTRAVVREFSLRIVESPVNLGLGASILRGVTTILENHDCVIVLEDDLLTSPGFWEYMNAALEFYRDERRVMHISGFMFPVDVPLPETFFYRPTTCWGWATWKNRWDKIITDPVELYRRVLPHKHAFNLEGAYDFFAQIENNLRNGLETWAILWQATVFLENGLSLHPGRSLTKNIGFDGSGENSLAGDRAHATLTDAVRVEKIPVVESKAARAAMRRFYLCQRASPWARARYRFLSRIPIEVRRYVQSFLIPKKIRIRRELSRLERQPRYAPGRSDLIPGGFSYADAGRFAARFMQFFLSERYDFPAVRECPRIVATMGEEGTALKYYETRHPKANLVIFDPVPEHRAALQANGFEVVNALADVQSADAQIHANGIWAGYPRFIDRLPTLSVPTLDLNDYLKTRVDLLILHRPELLPQLELDGVERLWIEWRSAYRQAQNLSQTLAKLESSGFRYVVYPVSMPERPFFRSKPSYGADGVYHIWALRR
jgi:hypothetical protein